MHITINGIQQEVRDNLTLQALVESLNLNGKAVVIERNGKIFSAPEFSAVQVQPGDVLEIVRFMGGG